jgi:tetratricopeptide (TPR) repeat protein
LVTSDAKFKLAKAVGQSRMVGLLLGLYMMVVFTISSSAQELGNTDVRPTSEMLLRHDEPTVRLQVPEMVELQKLVQTQRWTDANLLAAEFVGKNPKEPKGYLCLGYVQLRQHESVAAIRSLRRAQTLGLRDPQLSLTLGLAYYAVHQFDLFRDQMQKAIEAAPRDPWPHYYLGLYEIEIIENYEAGSRHFEEALLHAPQDFRILSYHSFCREVLGARDLARRGYEAAIRLVERHNAKFSVPYQRMALLLAETEPDLALEFARKAADTENDVASNHLILAKLYEDQLKIPEAVDALKAAARADPTLASPHYRLHRLFTRLGDLRAASEALAEFQSLSKLYGS